MKQSAAYHFIQSESALKDSQQNFIVLYCKLHNRDFSQPRHNDRGHHQERKDPSEGP